MCGLFVKAPFSLFLALRYLKPKRSSVSVITALSVLGVTLGISVLIVVISVMTGFDRSLQRAILGFEPHLKITAEGTMQNWRELKPKVDNVPGVLATAPYVQGPILIEHDDRFGPAVMRGIDIDLEKKILPLEKCVTGSLDMANDTVILGQVLANELGVGIGGEVTIFAPGNMSGLIEEIRKEKDNPDAKAKTLRDLKDEFVIPQPLKVAGIFKSGTNSFDATFVLVPLTNAQEIYAIKDGVHGLSVETRDPYNVLDLQGRIEEALDGSAFATSWYDENHERFDAIRTEKHVMFVILMFLIIIAAFGITSTLITVTVQKTREIGVMKALGATPTQIVWVFLFQGMFVGVFGNFTGVISALGMIHYRNPFRNWLNHTFHLNVFPVGIYEFDGIPAEIIPRDVAIICASAFAICSLAALVPAYIASQLDPVKALRYE